MRSDQRISADGFFYMELWRDNSVFRPAPLWTPAAMWNAIGPRPFQRGSIHTRLATRNDFQSQLHLRQDAIRKALFNTLDTLTGNSIFLLRITTYKDNSSQP